MRSNDTAQSGASRPGRRLGIPGVFGHLSVRRKLYLSFGCVVALLVSVVGVAFFAMTSLDSAHKRVTNQVLPQVLAADAARSAAGDMHFSQTRYVLVPERVQGLPAATGPSSSRTSPPCGKTATADGRAGVNKISAAFAHVNALDAKLHAAVLAGDTAAAKAIVDRARQRRLRRAGRRRSRPTRRTWPRSALRRRRASTRRARPRTCSWAGSALAAVLVALALAYVISRSLVGGIRQLLDGGRGHRRGRRRPERRPALQRRARRDGIGLPADDRLPARDGKRRRADRRRRPDRGRHARLRARRARACVRRHDHQPARDRRARWPTAATALSGSSQQVATTSEEAGRAVERGRVRHQRDRRRRGPPGADGRPGPPVGRGDRRPPPPRPRASPRRASARPSRPAPPWRRCRPRPAR